jgi:O-antigen/teichoic acid export membrane protein
VGWATLMSWGRDGISALTTIILALILGPSDFGLVVIALTIVGVIELFVSMGFVGAIVQRVDLEEVDLDSIFWLTLGLGLVLTIGGAACAGVVAGYLEISGLVPIIQALSLSVLIRGLTVVQEAKLTREMNFKSLALRTNLSMIGGAVVGLLLAVWGAGVWALVGQSLARGVFGLIMLWRAAHWIPKFRIHWQHTREMVIFSIKYFPATLFDYFGSQAEPLIIGKFFGPAAVGIYRLAMRLIDLIITVVTRALWYVSFPYFAEAKGDAAILRIRIVDCLRYSALFSLPVLAIVGLESPALVHWFGPKWSQASDVIRILCVYGALRALVLFMGPLLVALGRPQHFSMIMGLQVTSLCVGFAVAGVFLADADVQTQVSGIAWTRVAIYAGVFLPIAVWVMMRGTGGSLAALGSSVVPGLAVGAAASAVQIMLLPLTEWMQAPAVVGIVLRSTCAGVAAVLAILLVDSRVRSTVGRVYRSRILGVAAPAEPGTSS